MHGSSAPSVSGTRDSTTANPGPWESQPVVSAAAFTSLFQPQPPAKEFRKHWNSLTFGSIATGRERVQEALEVVGVQHRRDDRTVAVRVRIADGVGVEEALEVVGVQHRKGRGAVAVGIAMR